MLTAVDKVKKGTGRTVNKRFAVMCAHYLFGADTGRTRTHPVPIGLQAARVHG